MSEFNSLLPRNSTAVERQLERTLAYKYRERLTLYSSDPISCDSEEITCDSVLITCDAENFTSEYTLPGLDTDIVRKSNEPNECPAELLPWLAYALSVDDWHDNWSESTKRGVIENSVAHHRKKGTLGAVKAAIRNLGLVDFTIQERADNAAISPGYFWLSLLATDAAANSGIKQKQLLNAIDNSKKLSAHYQAFLKNTGTINQSHVAELLVIIYDHT